MKKWILLLLVAGLGSCVPKVEKTDLWIGKLRADPYNTEAMAKLAIIGRPMVEELLQFLEEEADRTPALWSTVPTVLAVAGEPCAKPMVAYLDHGQDSAIKSLILDVFIRGGWSNQARRLADRIDDPEFGPDIQPVISRIWDGEVPPSPWVDGELDLARKEEWNRWVGRNLKGVGLDLRQSRWEEKDLQKLEKVIRAELQYWR